MVEHLFALSYLTESGGSSEGIGRGKKPRKKQERKIMSKKQDFETGDHGEHAGGGEL